MIPFQLSDITLTIDQETRDLICDLVLQWARFDSLVTHWAIRSFGMGPDEGAIFIGNMDTKTKLDRLKALNSHFGFDGSVTKIADLSKLVKTHSEVRNAICHKACAGHQKSDPDRLVFASVKPYPKHPGHMTVELIHLNQIRDAVEFAKTSADQISAIVDKLAETTEAQSGQSRPPR